MSRAESRFIMMLTIVPLGFAAMSVGALELVSALPYNENDRYSFVFLTVTLLGIVLALFHRAAFRRGRAGKATIGWSGLLFVNLVIFRPIFAPTHCGNDDVLRSGQTILFDGCWIALCILCWYGASCIFGGKRLKTWNQEKGDEMTRSATRMAFCFSMCFLLPGVLFVTFVILDELADIGTEATAAVSYWISILLGMAIWIAIWQKTVTWTRTRINRTIIASLPLLACPLMVWTGLEKLGGAYRTIAGIHPLIIVGLWIAATAIIWRDSDEPSERLAEKLARGAKDSRDMANDVRCAKCDYSLKGLSEVRCPECGWTSTIDAVVNDAILALVND